MNFTAISKDIPGLKYLGVFLKWMVYGDVTIWIALNSASTISLPVSRCRNTFTHKLMMQNDSLNIFFFSLIFVWEILHSLNLYESHTTQQTKQAQTDMLSFLPLSVITLTATNKECPTRPLIFSKVCVMCSLFSVTTPIPLAI